ncbi:hypothetical protein [Variovorax terrae]|uniref:Integral membrane protein n=1 Tax=Variovorax terrae TaxID=2923278 RepID=A0A9X2ANC0_9BURK|nr:hypothetical protein [Variovorax terrae]MCJ0764239.1 hypothetical protein [Variovorax terrae]
MSLLSSPHFLRNVLWADAVSCLATGLLQVLFTGAAAQLLGLPAALLAWSGLFLLAYAGAVAYLATRKPVPRAAVWAIVAGNLGWAAGCVGLLAGGWLAPTLLGQAYVVVQALTVAVLAELQFFGLRKGAARAAW